MQFVRMRLIAALGIWCLVAPSAYSQPNTIEPPAARARVLPFLTPPGLDESVSETPARQSRLLLASDFGIFIPGHGPVFDRLRGGLSTGIGLSIPMGTIGEIPSVGSIDWNAVIDYRYVWLRKRQDTQRTFPAPGISTAATATSIWLNWVGNRPGQPTPFDAPLLVRRRPFRAHVFRAARRRRANRRRQCHGRSSAAGYGSSPNRHPGARRERAFVGGYELYARMGIVFPNGIEFGVRTGYGQLFTNLLQSETSSNNYAPLILNLNVPLPLRSRAGQK